MTGSGRRWAWALAGAAAAGLCLPAAGQAAIVFQRAPGSLKAMYIADDDGGHAHRLPGAGTDPVISPDGTKVAYSRFGRNGIGALRILTIAKGSVVASPQVCRWTPVWSPDSTRLLCGTETARSNGIVTGDGLALVDAATGAPTTLVAAPRHDVEAATWSPHGKRIAYSDGRFGSGRWDVYVADPADMAGAVRVVRNAGSPVWGPKRIAVSHTTSRRVRMHGTPTTVIHSQIWTAGPRGGAHALTRYRTGNFLVTGPAPAFWTPDGTRIIGQVGGEDFSQLIAVDARTGRIRSLRPAGERVTFPDAVSADGRTVLFTDGRIEGVTSLRTVPVTGGRVHVLLRGVSSVSVSAGWKP